MFAAMEFSPEQEDLGAFSAYLQQLQFPHRLTEHEGKIVLFVYQQEHQQLAIDLYRRFCLSPDVSVDAVAAPAAVRQRFAIRQYPVSLLLVLACIAGFLLVFLQAWPYLSLLSFQGFDFGGESLLTHSFPTVRQQLAGGEWWRLVTPVFLHFDIMHVTFNVTILWFLGSQIEAREGSLKLFMHVMAIGLVSNLAQYYYLPQNLFGGMSGVNYGLLAYCALLNFLLKKNLYFVPSGFLLVSVVMMVLGFLDVFSLFGYAIANWAHLAGFLAGLLLALVFYGRHKTA